LSEGKERKILKNPSLPFRYFKKAVLKIYKRLWIDTCEYSGRGAEIVKTIPVLIIAILIFYPAWSFPIYLWLSLVYGPPLSYILYALWVGQILVLALALAYIDYVRKSREK
jgi:hypothetical protein